MKTTKFSKFRKFCTDKPNLERNTEQNSRDVTRKFHPNVAKPPAASVPTPVLRIHHGVLRRDSAGCCESTRADCNTHRIMRNTRGLFRESQYSQLDLQHSRAVSLQALTVVLEGGFVTLVRGTIRERGGGNSRVVRNIGAGNLYHARVVRNTRGGIFVTLAGDFVTLAAGIF